MKFGVIVFPGANCDHDCYHVIKHVFLQDVDFIWHKEEKLIGYDCLVLPGGFSYGDYLRPGAIVKFSPIMKEVKRFAESGGLVLGICNGFQILLEADLLPGAMMRNRSLKFICSDVYLKLESDETPFTNRGRVGGLYKMPIAHFDGNYFADEETLQKLEENQQVIFKYCSEDGDITDDANLNGALWNISAICNRERNVLGMMPHPERCCESILGNEDGRLIFESIIKSIL
ncbi:MAG: phosphoribosylformylglycinamidine synthase subunit PurQ [Thermodesulfobacteriota bacterium]|nr:phosphoribosylformylglycinamidine synthase subunit PurQ [Thermodesulfobacteriota bacterium]